MGVDNGVGVSVVGAVTLGVAVAGGAAVVGAGVGAGVGGLPIGRKTSRTTSAMITSNSEMSAARPFQLPRMEARGATIATPWGS